MSLWKQAINLVFTDKCYDELVVKLNVNNSESITSRVCNIPEESEDTRYIVPLQLSVSLVWSLGDSD